MDSLPGPPWFVPLVAVGYLPIGVIIVTLLFRRSRILASPTVILLLIAAPFVIWALSLLPYDYEQTLLTAIYSMTFGTGIAFLLAISIFSIWVARRY